MRAYYARLGINQANVGNVQAIAHHLDGKYGIRYGLADAMVQVALCIVITWRRCQQVVAYDSVVVPGMHESLAVLDVDSDAPAAFDGVDREALEALTAELGRQFSAVARA